MKHSLAASLLMLFAILGPAKAPAFAEDFSLVFRNQRVTLIARDMPVSRILDRWSQIGGTLVVNGAAIQGATISLQLTDVSEREALEILLRGADGYIIAERDDATAGASSIGKILILPKSGSPRNPPPLNAAFDRPANSPVVSAQVDQPFVPTTSDVPPPVSPPSSAPAAFVPPGFGPIQPTGTARPGEATAQVPSTFKIGPTPTGQPGQVPPLERTVIVTGPGATPPEARVPSEAR